MITQTTPRISVLSLLITALALVSGCSSQPSHETYRAADRQSISIPSRVRPSRPTAVGERAADIALAQVGIAYRYGGSNRTGFDCSGLVHYSYAEAGKRVPRTTGQLWAAARSVNRNELRVGDVLFFEIEGKMSHVGMYIGDRKFVHAPSSGRTVTVGKLDSPFYSAAYLRAGRL